MNDTNRNFKKEQKLLENPLINKAEIYKQMGISRGHFHDKLNGNNGARFTDIQKDEITKILKKLGGQFVDFLLHTSKENAKKKV